MSETTEVAEFTEEERADLADRCAVRFEDEVSELIASISGAKFSDDEKLTLFGHLGNTFWRAACEGLRRKDAKFSTMTDDEMIEMLLLDDIICRANSTNASA